jgi:LmbE family N-acetylglucosaminyl deacetylase
MAGNGRQQLRALHRRLLVLLARDITAQSRVRTALVLAPHPDDETIACGATIAAKSDAGTRVRVAIAADGGDEWRRREALAACARLGVDASDVVFLGLPDGDLAGHGSELDAAVRTLLAEPVDELFFPSYIDAHPDHRALAEAVDRLPSSMVAGTALLAYPVWFWHRRAWVEPSAPRWQQVVQPAWRSATRMVSTRSVTVSTAGRLDRKRDALAAHGSQVAGAGEGGRRLDPAWLAMFLGREELFFVVRGGRRAGAGESIRGRRGGGG